MQTHRWERSEGVLLYNLERKLRNPGVEFNPVPTKELIEKLVEFRVRRPGTLPLPKTTEAPSVSAFFQPCTWPGWTSYLAAS